MLSVLLNKVSIIKTADILNERIALKNISFELNGGSIFTILGKNGSGKSTLLKSLTGLLDRRFYSFEGKVIYNEKDILKMNDNELQKIRREDIKYVFQDPVNSFDHLKTFKYYFENLSGLPQKNISHYERSEVIPFSNRINRLLRRGLLAMTVKPTFKITSDDEFKKETDELLRFFLLPDSKTLFKMYPYEVSGGMAQRISLILALLAKPKIIFLDEPTSGIDAPIANLLLIKLREFVNQGNAALMVTQDIELAKSASNKIALLSESKLSEFLPPDEFFNQYPIMAEL